MNFKLGDKVKLIITYGAVRAGSIGIIVDPRIGMPYRRVGIQFDFRLPGFHDCDNRGLEGRCYYVDRSNLVLIDEIGFDELIEEAIGSIYEF